MTDRTPRPPRFDAALGAWLLSRHADVVAALRDERLSALPDGGEPASAQVAMRQVAMRQVAMRQVAMRRVAARAFSAERLAAWRAHMEQSARRCVARLPFDEPLDLVRDVAQPWSLELALLAGGVDPRDGPALASLARQVFLASAHATGPLSSDTPDGAIVELARRLSGANGALAVQSFIAISQTLPVTLAGAWLELSASPAAWRQLRESPGRLPLATDELLRLASPARAVFRQARAATAIGAAQVARGERVVLLLSAANRDPARFPDPDRLHLDRDAAGHVGLGRGVHPCVGAPIVRLALVAASAALVATAARMEPAGRVSWLDGYSIRGPSSLPVVMRA